jgi:hypothetical protein
MACGYISSNDNRLYAALELTYGQVAAITGANRIPAVKLTAKQALERPDRKDKTGTRTYAGTPAGLRKRTTFDLTTYMTAWTAQDAEPAYGPLFQACLGSAGALFAGGAAVANANTKLLSFSAAHNLAPGQAVTFGSDLRFVSSIVDGTTVELNAPFTIAPGTGAPIGATVSYQPATLLDTVSLFDYWSPAGGVHRILSGAAMNELRVGVNGDYHEFRFTGSARDVIDSASFEAQQGGLASFPEEPPAADFDYTIVPGHLGQAWLGNGPDQFFTVTAAEITIDNDIDARAYEFGSDAARCIAPGLRTVTADIELFEVDDGATKALYQAARHGTPIAVMLQLGQQSSQLAGVYLKSVAPEVPEFDDGQSRLQWKFSSCRAQGTGNDEVYLAFG